MDKSSQRPIDRAHRRNFCYDSACSVRRALGLDINDDITEQLRVVILGPEIPEDSFYEYAGHMKSFERFAVDIQEHTSKGLFFN